MREKNMQLTDQMIHDTLVKSGKTLSNVSVAILAIAILCTILSIVIFLYLKKKKAKGEEPSRQTRQLAYLPLLFAVPLFLVFFLMRASATKQLKAADNFQVVKQTVVNKGSEKKRISRSKGRSTTTTYYYLYFSDYGKKKVSTSQYTEYQKNDKAYVVAYDGDIMLIYNAKKYKYTGEQ